jgi:hypothetical protein
MKDGFAHGPATRWILYAISFGLLWGLLAEALIFGDRPLEAAVRGAIGGVLFATIAVRRETRGLRRRR